MEYVTVVKACEKAEISKTTFYKWKRKGLLEGMLKPAIGGAKVHLEAFLEWVETQKRA